MLFAFSFLTLPLVSQDPVTWLSSLPQAKDYVQKRASSYDRSGANADSRTIAAGETLTLLDDAGPGLISHVWFTIASDDPHHLKALILRMYWDGEATPSVEAPVGHFFGLGQSRTGIERAARGISGAVAVGAADSADLSCGWAGECGKVSNQVFGVRYWVLGRAGIGHG